MSGRGGHFRRKEEVSALRGIFALYDPDGTGEIGSVDLESLLQKIGTTSASGLARPLESLSRRSTDSTRRCDRRRFARGARATERVFSLSQTPPSLSFERRTERNRQRASIE